MSEIPRYRIIRAIIDDNKHHYGEAVQLEGAEFEDLNFHRGHSGSIRTFDAAERVEYIYGEWAVWGEEDISPWGSQ